MRILHVVPSLSGSFGGPAKAAIDLSRALAGMGETVSIFTTEADDSIKNNEISIEVFPKSGGNFCYSPALKKRLEDSITNFDVLHIHGLWTYPTLIASRIARRHDVPYVIRPCGMLDPYCLSHHPVRKGIYGILFEKKNLNSAKAVHFTSLEEQERSLKFGIKSKSAVIPLGLQQQEYVNSPNRGEFRKKHPALKDKKIILFLGRLSFKKGLDLLVEAVSKIVQTDKEVHLVIAGSDEEGYRKILDAKIPQGAEWLTFLGYTGGRDKSKLFRDSDIFCLPSHQENFGLAVAEAMAACLPVVVSDQVNIHREISAAQAGLVVPINSAYLAAALEKLLANPELRLQMGINGRKLVEEKYCWDQIVNDVIGLYRSIVR